MISFHFVINLPCVLRTLRRPGFTNPQPTFINIPRVSLDTNSVGGASSSVTGIDT